VRLELRIKSQRYFSAGKIAEGWPSGLRRPVKTGFPMIPGRGFGDPGGGGGESETSEHILLLRRRRKRVCAKDQRMVEIFIL